jgi:hypothetical protein
MIPIILASIWQKLRTSCLVSEAEEELMIPIDVLLSMVITLFVLLKK